MRRRRRRAHIARTGHATTRPTDDAAVLVVTDERDGPVKAVVQELRERGCRTFVAGTQSLPDGTRGVTASIEPGAPRGIHDDDGRFVRFDELRSVWAWRPHSPKAGHPDPDVSRYLDKEWRLALAGLAQGSQPLWVNHPRAERWLEGNKLAQLALARACGLAVPETIQSSVPDHVVAFAERFSAVAVKTAGGFLRQVDDCARFAYTQRMTAEELHRSRRAIAAARVLVEHDPVFVLVGRGLIDDGDAEAGRLEVRACRSFVLSGHVRNGRRRLRVRAVRDVEPDPRVLRRLRPGLWALGDDEPTRLPRGDAEDPCNETRLLDPRDRVVAPAADDVRHRDPLRPPRHRERHRGSLLHRRARVRPLRDDPTGRRRGEDHALARLQASRLQPLDGDRDRHPDDVRRGQFRLPAGDGERDRSSLGEARAALGRLGDDHALRLGARREANLCGEAHGGDAAYPGDLRQADDARGEPRPGPRPGAPFLIVGGRENDPGDDRTDDDDREREEPGPKLALSRRLFRRERRGRRRHGRRNRRWARGRSHRRFPRGWWALAHTQKKLPPRGFLNPHAPGKPKGAGG